MAWCEFLYKSGTNPYITKTEKETKRILKKYKGKIEQIKTNIYLIDDTKEAFQWNY